MTLTEERPMVGDGVTPLSEARRSPVATWRFAARLARREVRRRPGRSVLVALLIAVPVMAMTVASVVYRSASDSWPDGFARRAGAADLMFGGAGDLLVTDRIDRELPPGARSVVAASVWERLQSAAGVEADRYVQFTDLDVTDPLAEGIVELIAGRAPRAPGEILLDRRTADDFGVDVGDVLRLDRPSGDWSVAGIGRLTDQHSAGLLVAPGFDHERLRPGSATYRVLIELPAGADAQADAERLIAEWETVTSDTTIESDVALQCFGCGEHRWAPNWFGYQEGPQANALAWGWVAGVMALVAVGIVITAAFATSARRQLVTIGHLAANGAPRRLVRRTLSLQGSWTGLAGALLGVAVAIPLLFLGRPIVEYGVDRSFGRYVFSPLDLVVIVLTAVAAATIAAAVPARTAARVPVLGALAGRRPLGTPPRWLAPTGATLFAGGLLLLFVAATGAASAGGGDNQVFAAVALAGGVAVLLGMCCATPLVVALVGKLGGSAGSGTWRLAARSTARVRTRSAGVVTAVGTAAALAVAGVTLASVWLAEEANPAQVPRDVAYVDQWTSWWNDGTTPVDPGPLEPYALPADVVDGLERILPDATWVPVRSAGVDPPPFDPQQGCVGTSLANYAATCETGRVATIADPALVDAMALPDSVRDLLGEVDFVEMTSSDNMRFRPDRPQTVTIVSESGHITASMQSAIGPVHWSWWTLISPERAEALGFDIVEDGLLLVNPTDLTDAQVQDIEDLVYGDEAVRSAFVEPGDPPEPALDAAVPTGPDHGLSLRLNWSAPWASAVVVNALIIAVAVLLTLLIVAVGLALSATESRDERDVLVAVGARPRTLSRVAGAKAVVLAGTGVLLGVPTGYLPMWVVYRTVDGYPASAGFPWVAVGLIVVAVPLVAGLVAWAASSIARRVRPVTITSFDD